MPVAIEPEALSQNWLKLALNRRACATPRIASRGGGPPTEKRLAQQIMCDAVGPEVGVQDGIEVARLGIDGDAQRPLWIACGLCRRSERHEKEGAQQAPQPA